VCVCVCVCVVWVCVCVVCVVVLGALGLRTAKVRCRNVSGTWVFIV
jgi:hypothetical protein